MNERRIPAEVFPPSELIKEELGTRGWSYETLATEMGCKLKLVEEMLDGKRRITLMLAHKLSTAFGTGAQFWLNLQTAYDSK